MLGNTHIDSITLVHNLSLIETYYSYCSYRPVRVVWSLARHNSIEKWSKLGSKNIEISTDKPWTLKRKVERATSTWWHQRKRKWSVSRSKPWKLEKNKAAAGGWIKIDQCTIGTEDRSQGDTLCWHLRSSEWMMIYSDLWNSAGYPWRTFQFNQFISSMSIFEMKSTAIIGFVYLYQVPFKCHYTLQSTINIVFIPIIQTLMFAFPSMCVYVILFITTRHEAVCKWAK